MDMTEMQARELDQSLWRDLEAVVRDGVRVELHARAAPLRGRSSAASARRPSCSAASTSATGCRSPGRSTASTWIRSARAGSCRTTSRASTRTRAREIESELRLQIPLYMLVLRDLVGLEPLGGLYRPLAGERKARGLLRATEGDTLKGYATQRLPRGGGVLGRRRSRTRDGARLAGRIRGGDVVHDPKGGDARSGAISGRSAGCRAHERAAARSGRGDAARSSSPQAPARARRPCSSSGSCARSATAGSTSTRSSSSRTRARAAGELRTRIRAALARARPARPRARARRRVDLDDPRLLPAAAEGVPVRRRARPALPRARRRAGRGAAQRGVSSALDEFYRDGDPDRLRLLATYGADGLRRMLTGVYETLRSAGRELSLEHRRRAATWRAASRSCARRRAASPRRRRRPTTSARRRRSCSRCSIATRAPTG